MSKPKEITTSAIVEQEGQFLLVEEGYSGEFNLPGGGLKRRETLVDCALRETHEESGVEVEPFGIVGLYQDCKTRTGHNNLTRVVFACRPVGGELTISAKHPTVEYFEFEEIKKLHKNNQLRNPAVKRAIRDYRRGQIFDMSILSVINH